MDAYPSNLLKYEPKTGEFFWLPRDEIFFKTTRSHRGWNTRYSGKQAGSLREGYIWISVNGSNYSAHRLAWLFIYGVWPPHDIDHINGEKTDNRIENLRSVTKAENNKNTPIRKNNTTGVVGVYWKRLASAWDAELGVSGKLVNIGRYKRFEEAVSARKMAEIDNGYHANHGRCA